MDLHTTAHGPATTRVRCRFTCICMLSASLYCAWGIWPVVQFLTIEWERRQETHFCDPVTRAGIGYAVLSLLSAACLVGSWASFGGCCRRCSSSRRGAAAAPRPDFGRGTGGGGGGDGGGDGGGAGGRGRPTDPFGRKYSLPLLAHSLSFLGSFFVTIDASVSLWGGDIGKFCQLESPPFHAAASTYVQVTYGMLLVQLGVCAYMCRLVFLLFRSPGAARELVLYEMVPNPNRMDDAMGDMGGDMGSSTGGCADEDEGGGFSADI